MSSMRNVFLEWTSKRSWFLPLPYGAHKEKENILYLKVFGTKLRRRELVLRTEFLKG